MQMPRPVVDTGSAHGNPALALQSYIMEDGMVTPVVAARAPDVSTAPERGSSPAASGAIEPHSAPEPGAGLPSEDGGKPQTLTDTNAGDGTTPVAQRRVARVAASPLVGTFVSPSRDAAGPGGRLDSNAWHGANVVVGSYGFAPGRPLHAYAEGR